MTNTPSIDVLAERIAVRLAVLGLSERQASLQATGRPDAIRYIRTRKAMPSWERLVKIAEVLEADPSYLYGYTEDNVWNDSVREALQLAKNMTGEALAQFGHAEHADDTAPCLKSTVGPLFEVQSPHSWEALHIATTVTSVPIIHTLSVPEPIRGKSVIGYQVVGREMEPLYKDGSFVLMETNSKPRVNDVVVIDLGAHGEGGRLSFVASLVGRTKTVMTFCQFNPSAEFQIPVHEIDTMHRIVTYSELITFW